MDGFAMDAEHTWMERIQPRVIFFGMECDFSLPALLSLLEHEIEVCAVVVPDSASKSFSGAFQSPAIQLREPPRVVRGSLPMFPAMSPSIVQLAWQRGIPVWAVQKLSAALTRETLSAYHPDFICVACFSAIIPSSILSIPSQGCLNVHPSLLPMNRGPVPVFWTFREGHATTGVTIHSMTRTLDSGDILAQEVIPVPEGIRYAQLEGLCATLGGELLAQVVWDVVRGQVIPKPQDETKSSYYPNPSDADYVVTTREWDVRRLYNFIRGVAGEDNPVELIIDDQHLLATDALFYSYGDLDRENEGEMDAVQRVPCLNGWVSVHYREAGR
jgi:methionyl-tRNA formyltransferase